MKVKVNSSELELVQGDITQQDTQAIVNAANKSLRGGGGVDGAIHRAAGPELLKECSQLGGCETGDAKPTKGYNLKADYVIHAVGPVYRPGDPGCERLLESAYRRSLETARDHGIESVAFPSISTGAYGYPMAEAASVALRTVIRFLEKNPEVKVVRFVLFGDEALKAYERQLQKLKPPGGS
jgi:O-acetyl-ADP-ribose deacetylase (regulator of RNase III)